MEEEIPATCDYYVTVPINQYVFPEEAKAKVTWDIPVEMDEEVPEEKVKNPLEAIGSEVKKKKLFFFNLPPKGDLTKCQKKTFFQIQCHFPIHPNQENPLRKLPYCTKEIVYFITHGFAEYAALTQPNVMEIDDDDEKENVDPAPK